MVKYADQSNTYKSKTDLCVCYFPALETSGWKHSKNYVLCLHIIPQSKSKLITYFRCLHVCFCLHVRCFFFRIHKILLNKGIDLLGATHGKNNTAANIGNTLGSFILHLAISDVLKAVELRPNFTVGLSISNLVETYSEGILTLEEVLENALRYDKKIITQKPTNGKQNGTDTVRYYCTMLV